MKIFQSLKQIMEFFSIAKSPVVIAARRKHACYHHVVVVWKGMVIDYGSKYMYPLMNDSLTQICGVTSTFRGIICSYGIFPSVHICQSFDNIHIDDWGYTEYSTRNSQIRKYFKN
jgi:hypothetical protein